MSSAIDPAARELSSTLHTTASEEPTSLLPIGVANQKIASSFRSPEGPENKPRPLADTLSILACDLPARNSKSVSSSSIMWSLRRK